MLLCNYFIIVNCRENSAVIFWREGLGTIFEKITCTLMLFFPLLYNLSVHKMIYGDVSLSGGGKKLRCFVFNFILIVNSSEQVIMFDCLLAFGGFVHYTLIFTFLYNCFSFCIHFQVFLSNTNTYKIFNCPINRTLIGNTTPNQSGPGSNGNKENWSFITRCSKGHLIALLCQVITSLLSHLENL